MRKECNHLLVQSRATCFRLSFSLLTLRRSVCSKWGILFSPSRIRIRSHAWAYGVMQIMRSYVSDRYEAML